MSYFSCTRGLRLEYPSGKVLRSLNRRCAELGVKLLPVAPDDLICLDCTKVWESFGDLELCWPVIMERFGNDVRNVEIEASPVHMHPTVVQRALLSTEPNGIQRVPGAPASTPDDLTDPIVCGRSLNTVRPNRNVRVTLTRNTDGDTTDIMIPSWAYQKIKDLIDAGIKDTHTRKRPATSRTIKATPRAQRAVAPVAANDDLSSSDPPESDTENTSITSKIIFKGCVMYEVKKIG